MKKANVIYVGGLIQITEFEFLEAFLLSNDMLKNVRMDLSRFNSGSLMSKVHQGPGIKPRQVQLKL